MAQEKYRWPEIVRLEPPFSSKAVQNFVFESLERLDTPKDGEGFIQFSGKLLDLHRLQELKAFKSILLKSKLKSSKLVLKKAMNMMKVSTNLKRKYCVPRIKLGKLKLVVGE